MPVFCNRLSMNSNIFFLRLSDDGLSVTTTNDGLLEDALINPHDPSSNENLIPFTVNTSLISCPSILLFKSLFMILIVLLLKLVFLERSGQ